MKLCEKIRFLQRYTANKGGQSGEQGGGSVGFQVVQVDADGVSAGSQVWTSREAEPVQPPFSRRVLCVLVEAPFSLEPCALQTTTAAQACGHAIWPLLPK